MTLVNIDLRNQGYETSPGDRVVFYSLLVREGEFGTITTAPVEVWLEDGQGTVDLAPGPVGVQIIARQVADTRVKEGRVPMEGPTTLNVVLTLFPEYSDAIRNQFLAAIHQAQDTALTRIDAEVAIAVGAEMGGVTDMSKEALSRAKNAEGVAATADSKSTSATSTASTAISAASNAVTRVTALEAMGGLFPESPVDGQTANLLMQVDTLTRAATSTVVRSVVYDVSPTGTLEGDKTAVIAAALAAKERGDEIVRLADGHYHLDRVTPTDIHDRYLVGENATVSPESWVFPFKPHEWVGRSSRAGNVGGAGRIAIEVDDAASAQWTTLFPLTKALGVPLSLSWHTGFSSTGWVHEAYRHGWEIMSHLPDNFRAPDLLAGGTLDAMAQESLDAVRGIVGPDVPVGFVYPAHIRTDETDRVLSKYYDRGRGAAGAVTYSREMPNEWLTTAYALDPHFAGGVISEEAKRLLRHVSRTDSQMVFYMHWITGDEPTKGPALTQFVRYAQSLGIEIVTSGQIWGDRNYVDDPYFTKPGWLTVGGAAISETVSYHGGKSAAFAAPGPGNMIASVYGARRPVESKPAMFTKIRLSYRRRNTSDVAFSSNGQGIKPKGVIGYRKRTGEQVRATGLADLGGVVNPMVGQSVPAGEWVQETCEILLNPSVSECSFGVGVSNMLPGSELYVDELRAEPAGHVREHMQIAKLAGTGNVFIRTPVVDLHTKCHIHLEPVAPMVGTLTMVAYGNSALRIYSSDAADTMDVRVHITPRDVWYDDE